VGQKTKKNHSRLRAADTEGTFLPMGVMEP